MARYMGAPRCRPGLAPKFRRRRAFIPDIDSDDSDEQTRDEIPDSDDNESSSQGQPEALEGENRDGIAYYDGDSYDSDHTTSASGFALPFPGLKADVNAENAISNNEPRPKKQRSLSIPIHYNSRFTTGMPIFEPQPLPIAYGWMVRGTAQHIEDLHLSGIPFCNKQVHSKTKIEVLGEYTWIELTPSQQESYERFPAIYVPGSARTWRPIQIHTCLDQEEARSITAQKIRDDNLNRQPRYPYEPALRALESSNKVTSLNEIDIVTDPDTLTQLLSFIMGTSGARRVKEPFRLELKTVRNTLFIHQAHKPGSSQAGPPPKKTRHDPSVSAPDWAAGVLAHIGTRAARLPYSGGHYRLVRYRFGSVVMAVRVKVDFVYEHRKDAPRASVDPLRDVQPEFMPRQEGDVAQVWKTTAKKQGMGTRPAGAGIASVRYVWQDPKIRMRAMLPQLWFSRSPFVVDCQVSYPDLCVKDVSLVNSRQWYPSYERGYQNSLRRLAGLLKHLQERTREMDGNIVLIADPVQVCFVLLKPVINMPALPEDLVLKFWGPDTEKEERERRLAEMDRDSTPEQEQSDLTDLSDTPSLPPGSDIANVGLSQPDKSQADGGATSTPVAGGSPTRAERQLAQGIDPVKMVTDWKKSVGSPMRQSVQNSGTGYESGDELSVPYDAAASFDGNGSSSQDSVMVGESALEAGLEGTDAVLNALAVQMNRPGVTQETEENLTSVARAGDVEVLRGQHSLLMADRHLTSGMHDSSDDEWPPRPRTNSIINRAPSMEQGSGTVGTYELESLRSSPVVPTAPTPLGPSDFDSSGNVIPRNLRNRDDFEADSDDDESAATRTPRDPPLTGRSNMAARGRARLGQPSVGQRRGVYHEEGTDSDDVSHTTSPEGEEDEAPRQSEPGLGRQRVDLEVETNPDEAWHTSSPKGEEDEEEDPTSIVVAGPEKVSDDVQDGVLGNGAATSGDSSTGPHRSSRQANGEEYDPAHEF